jgi:phage FluMu protein gp41
LADNTANVITGITVVLDYFKKLDAAMPSWLKTTLQFLERYNPLGQAKEALKILGELGEKEKALAEQRKNNFSDRGMNARAADLADKKAKKLLATNKGITKEKKAQAASDKLKGMFDLDAIQIAAALKGKISDLDRASLLAMQALKTEDKNDDISALKNLEQAKIAADAADRARKMEALQDTIKFNKLALADVESTLAKIIKLPVPAITYAGGLFAGTSLAPTGVNAGTQAPITPMMPPTNTGTAPVSTGDPFAAARAALPSVNFNPPAVAVTVNANTIADPDQLTRLIQAGIQAVARNGWSSSGSASGF